MRKLIDSLLIISIILNLIILISSYIPLFGYRTFEIISGSMKPTIQIEDIVVTKEKDSYKKGDIVTLQDDDIYYTHRIKEIMNKKVITKGDDNNTVDKEKNVSQIIGKVILIISGFQYLLIKLTCIGLLLISIILSIFKRKEK